MLFLDSVTMKETPGGRDEYPFSVPALRHLERLEFKTPITFLPAITAPANRRCWKGWRRE